MKLKTLPLIIPVILITLFVVYCWSVFIFTDYIAGWQHYFGLLFFLAIVVLVFKNRPVATLITGIFLLLGVFNLVAITPTITTHRFCILSLCTPNMQGLFLFLFIVYFIMNLKILINMELDYKERKAARKQSRL